MLNFIGGGGYAKINRMVSVIFYFTLAIIDFQWGGEFPKKF